MSPPFLSIKWDITGRCNLQCIFCYATSLYGDLRRWKKDLTLVEIEKILINITECTNVRSIMFLGGEPLLRKDLEKIIGLSADYGIETGLATNATLLRKGRICSLHKAGLNYLVISIDGPSANLHNGFRGADIYCHVLKNAALATKAGFKSVKMASVLFKKNANCIREMMDLAYDIGFDGLILSTLMLAGNAQNLVCYKLSADEYIGIAETIANAYNENCGKFMHDFVNMEFASPLLIEYLNHRFKTHIPIAQFECAATTRTLFVRADGRAFPCIRSCPDLALQKGTNYLTFGFDLLNSDFNDVWNSEDFKSLFSMISKQKMSETLTHCSNCKYFFAGCVPCPLSTSSHESQYAEYCGDNSVGKICVEIMKRMWLN